jgi:UDP-3-O-[3-hydroxymyristoyl] glucosamine N-acyltransferase LpxD
MDLEKVKGFIDKHGFKPEDVSYRADGVYIDDSPFLCSRPRYWFAKVLGLWEEDTQGLVKQQTNTFIHRSTIVGNNVQAGKSCVIGAKGFGYIYDDDGYLIDMPHHGNVIIGDNVTIHNNVNIDRAVLGSTVIGDGTKIDSLVHVAHGAKVGKHVLICAGAVLCGNAGVGDYSFIGVNACIKQKVKVGRNCVIAAGAVVVSDVPDNTVYGGVPAKLLKYTEPRDYKMKED